MSLLWHWQYDEIASDYDRDADERLERTCILIPSAQHYCGDLSGKDVLDLGCGSGFFSRLLKKSGARSLVALDLSPKMIELAKQYEERDSLGIQYHVGDASKLDSLGEFDVAFAAFLLHYTSAKDELQGMCNSVAANLRPGGRFVTFNENPSFPMHEGNKYDVSVSVNGEISDGVRITRTHYKDYALPISSEMPTITIF